VTASPGRSRRRLARAGALLAIAMLPACSIGLWRAEAFRRAPTLALVDLCVDPRVRYVDGTGEPLDAPVNASTDAVADAASAALRSALAGTGRFRLVEEQRVLSDPAYGGPASAPPAVTACRRTPGYRPVREPAAMARALRVDGAIVASLRLGYVVDGVSFAGVVIVGTVRGRAVLRLTALGPDGKRLWIDHIVATSDDSFSGASQGFDAARLDPLMLQAAHAAVRDLMARLDSHL
jgi:hypothetical protein